MNANRKKVWSMLMAAVLPLVAPPAAFAWTIEDLGDLAGGPSFSEAYGLNEAGEVVGYGTTAVTNEAFVWKRASGMSPLARARGFASCTANGINDGGLVAGACGSALSGKRSAMVWQAGQPREVSFNNAAALQSSEALAVNNLGEVAGTYREQLGSTLLDQAFTWDTRIANGTARGVTPLPADLGGSGRGNAINAQGYIAGNAIKNAGFVAGGINQDSHQPWLWSPAIVNSARAIAAVGGLPNATARFGDARGINDLPNVVGLYDGRGFLWTPHVAGATTGTTMPLPIEPYDINNKGQVVGVAQGRAKLFDVGANAVTDLSKLPEVTAAGWRVLSIARAINDKGQIVGTGVNAAGDVHAFLLSPDAQLRPLRPIPIREPLSLPVVR